MILPQTVPHTHSCPFIIIIVIFITIIILGV
jgi:hypothetical protein